MKIDAVELTLFAWDDIPPTKYTSGSQNQSGKSNLGLLTIKTDAGIEGNAFLGSATNPAETDAGALMPCARGATLVTATVLEYSLMPPSSSRMRACTVTLPGPSAAAHPCDRVGAGDR